MYDFILNTLNDVRTIIHKRIELTYCKIFYSQIYQSNQTKKQLKYQILKLYLHVFLKFDWNFIYHIIWRTHKNE